MNIFNLNAGKTKLTGLTARAFMLGISTVLAGSVTGQALVTNAGALVSITNGATVIVKTGTVHNQTGYISNNGTFIIENNFVNDDTATGGGARGFYRVQQDWDNNGTFVPDSSTVELYGANQLITGSSVTSFYDLKLTGSGIKSQTVNANVLDSLVLNDRELATDVNIMHVENPDPGAISKATGNLGFVSSLGAGRLAWDLNNTFTYRFPVGSSAGTLRYRPVQIRPDNATAQTFEVRMANVDATTESYDRSVKEASICLINSQYYHLIGRSAGSDPVQLTLLYDPAADGGWNMAGHWQNANSPTLEWEDMGNVVPGAVGGFRTLTVPAWNNFTNEAFALGRSNPKIDTATVSTHNLTCFNDSTGAISIDVTNGTPPYIYTWTPGNYNTEDISGLPAGTYTVQITDTFGCGSGFSSITRVLTQPAQIMLSATPTNVACNGGSTGSVSLAVDSAVLPIASYHWSNNATTQNINNVPAGTYVVEVTDNNGCKRDTSVEVTEPTAIDVTADVSDLNCYATGDGAITLNVSGGTPGTPAYTYTWSDTSLTSTASQSGLAAGTYYATVTDGNGCSFLDSFTVTQPDTLTLTASADTIIAIGYTANLDVLSTTGGTGSLSYEWTPAASINDPTSANTTATPSETTDYLVVGTDANGCKAADTVHVKVDINLITVPDGFTPNGDGRNDVFQLLTSPTVSVTEFKIFNRWGQLLSSDVNGWDGTFKGKPQPMETYVYQATIKLPDGSNVAKSGDFILIR